MGDEYLESSSDDSFSYTYSHKRDLEEAKRRVDAVQLVQSPVPTEYSVNSSSDSDDGHERSVEITLKKTVSSKRKVKVDEGERKSKRLRKKNPKDVGGRRCEEPDIFDLSSTDSTPGLNTNGIVIALESEEDEDVKTKPILTSSDSDVEVLRNDAPSVPEDETNNDENELISVKISWKLLPVQKFQLRRHQKFKYILEHFASLEGVPLQKIVLYGGKQNSRLIEPFDTPDTVGVQVTDIFEGGVLEDGGPVRTQRQRGLGCHMPDGLRVKIQVEGGVRSFPVMIDPKQRMQVLLVKVAEQMEVPVSQVRLFFDGNAVSSKSIIQDLGLEEDDILDLCLP